jgi:1,4-alpha-glucan branching enzyme
MKQKKVASETKEVEKKTKETEKAKTSEKAESPKPSITLSWQPEKVLVAGDFNDWNPHPESHSLNRDENGDWQIELELAPGTYEYCFVVDGKWMPDPTCETSVENPFGSYNSVLTVE